MPNILGLILVNSSTTNFPEAARALRSVRTFGSRFLWKNLYNSGVWSSRILARSTKTRTPHGVLFFDEMPELDKIKSIGSALEIHKNHPKRINVEFVKVLAKDLCEINIWERGCGITKACGTGACAVVAAGIKKGVFDSKVRVKMPGGILDIEQAKNGSIYMTGPVQEVAYGNLSGVFLEKLFNL